MRASLFFNCFYAHYYPPAPPPPIPPNHLSGTWVHCANSFAEAGGYEAIIARLQAQRDDLQSAPDSLDFEVLNEAAIFAQCVRQLRNVATPEWVNRHFKPLRDVLFELLEIAPPATLRQSAKDAPDIIMRSISLLWHDLCFRQVEPPGATQESRDSIMGVVGFPPTLLLETEMLTIKLASRALSLGIIERSAKALMDISRLLDGAAPKPTRVVGTNGLYDAQEDVSPPFEIPFFELPQIIESAGVLQAVFSLPPASLHASILVRLQPIIVLLARAGSEAATAAFKANYKEAATDSIGYLEEDRRTFAIHSRDALGSFQAPPEIGGLSLSTAESLWRLLIAQLPFDEGRRTIIETLRESAQYAPLAVLLCWLRLARNLPLEKYAEDIIELLATLTKQFLESSQQVFKFSNVLSKLEAKNDWRLSGSAARAAAEFEAAFAGSADALDETRTLALPLIWAACHASTPAGASGPPRENSQSPTADSRATTAVQDAAAKAFVETLFFRISADNGNRMPLESQLESFAIMAAKNLRVGVSANSNAQLLVRLLRAPAATRAESVRQQFIMNVASVKYVQLCAEIAEDASRAAVRLARAHADASGEGAPDIIAFLVTELGRAVSNAAPRDSIVARLDLIAWLGAALKRSLSIDEVDALWTALADAEPDTFFKWLRDAHCVSALKVVIEGGGAAWGECPLLPAVTVRTVFERIFLTERWNARLARAPAAETFYAFLIAAAASGELVDPPALGSDIATPRLRVRDASLPGLHRLWEMAIHAQDDATSSCAARALIAVHARLTLPLVSDTGPSRGAAWRAFTDKCMSEISALVGSAESGIIGAPPHAPGAACDVSNRSTRRILRLLHDLQAALDRERICEGAGEEAGAVAEAESLRDTPSYPERVPLIIPIECDDVPTLPNPVAAATVNARVALRFTVHHTQTGSYFSPVLTVRSLSSVPLPPLPRSSSLIPHPPLPRAPNCNRSITRRLLCVLTSRCAKSEVALQQL